VRDDGLDRRPCLEPGADAARDVVDAGQWTEQRFVRAASGAGARFSRAMSERPRAL